MTRNVIAFACVVACGLLSLVGVPSAQMEISSIRGRLPNLQTLFVGTGGATATLGGALTTSTTQACTTGLVEEDLWTYSLPANSLDADGRGIRIMAFGSLANNANAKTVNFYANALVVVGTGSQTTANGIWRLDVTLLRSGPATEVGYAGISSGVGGSSVQTLRGASLASTANTTSALPIKITGTTPTTIADVCVRGAVVETLR